MKCPNTTTCPDENLVMTERQGVEIDFAPPSPPRRFYLH